MPYPTYIVCDGSGYFVPGSWPSKRLWAHEEPPVNRLGVGCSPLSAMSAALGAFDFEFTAADGFEIVYIEAFQSIIPSLLE